MRGLLRAGWRRWVYPRHPNALMVRDGAGDYHVLRVGQVLVDDQVRIALGIDGHEPLVLRPLQAGWVRARMRDAVLTAPSFEVSE